MVITLSLANICGFGRCKATTDETMGTTKKQTEVLWIYKDRIEVEEEEEGRMLRREAVDSEIVR